MSAIGFDQQEDIRRLRDYVFRAFLKAEDGSWTERFLSCTQVALYDVMRGKPVPERVFDILREAAKREG